MDMITLIGLGAAFCTTAAFVPQVLQILKTGNVDGISLGMYSTFTLGVAMWLAYGFILNNIPMISANLVTLVLAGSVLVLTIKKRVAREQTIDIVSPEIAVSDVNEIPHPEIAANDAAIAKAA